MAGKVSSPLGLDQPFGIRGKLSRCAPQMSAQRASYGQSTAAGAFFNAVDVSPGLSINRSPTLRLGEKAFMRWPSASIQGWTSVAPQLVIALSRSRDSFQIQSCLRAVIGSTMAARMAGCIIARKAAATINVTLSAKHSGILRARVKVLEICGPLRMLRRTAPRNRNTRALTCSRSSR